MKLIQITDCHFCQNPEELFCKMYPDQGCQAVIALAKEQQPDVVLLTGDCSQDGSVESYQRLHRQFQQFACPVYAIPGNHDQFDNYQTHLLGGNIQQTVVLPLNDWQIVFLDSVIPGETAGHLKKDQFDLLQKSLEQGLKTIVVMHHHPYPVSGFMDRYIIDNHQKFVDAVENEPLIKAVLFGHIHSDFHQHINHIDFYGCPSSSVQFDLSAPLDSDGICIQQPGFRMIDLSSQHFSTKIIRC